MADKLMYIPNDDTQNYSFWSVRFRGWNVWKLNFMNQPIKIN